MPTYVQNASYIEPLSGASRTWLNVDPSDPIVVFGDHVSISGSAGPVPIVIGTTTYQNTDRIVVASAGGNYYPGSQDPIEPGQYVYLTWSTFQAPQQWRIEVGTVDNPTAYNVFTGSGDVTNVVFPLGVMPPEDMVISVSGVGFQANANFSYGLLIDTSPTQPVLPDLVITGVHASTTTFRAGDTITLSADVANIGNYEFPSGLVGFYLSSDGTLDNAILLRSTGAGRYAVGATSTVSTTFTLPSSLVPGNYSIIAVADSAHDRPELNEGNNVSSPIGVTVRPPLPTLSITPVDAGNYEGDTGTTPFQFLVTRSGDLSSPSSVQWSVGPIGVSPVDAADFGGAFPTGTVTFAAGQATATVTVNVTGDTTIENSSENFTVVLTNPVAATIQNSTAQGVILNDDGTTLIDYNTAGALATFAIWPNIWYYGDIGTTADGHYVVFQSVAQNLPSGLVYIRDMWTGTTSLVAQAPDGTTPNNLTTFIAGSEHITSDGRYVLFVTYSTNLVSGGTRGDQLVRDMLTGELIRLFPAPVSVASIVDGGHNILFQTTANHPELGDSDGLADYYVINIDTRQLRFLSGLEPTDWICGNGGDGRYFGVVRSGTAYVYDSTSASLTAVGSGLAAQSFVSGLAAPSFVDVSDNGQLAVFASSANLLPGDTANNDIYLRNLSTGSLTLISATPSGGFSDGHSADPRISADGRFVVFWSSATDILPGNSSQVAHMFLRDVAGNRTVFIANNASEVEFSEDGRYVMWWNSEHYFSFENPFWTPMLTGGAANDVLSGDKGDNLLRGNGGSDRLFGGAGHDTADYSGSLTGLVIDLANPSNNTGEAAGDTYISIEGVKGSDFGDTIRGDSTANVLDGGAGNDTLNGAGGNDSLYGGANTDTAVFSGNRSQYSISSSGGVVTVIDSVAGRDGTDTLTGIESLQFADGNSAAAPAVPTISSNGGGASAAIFLAENTRAATTVVATDLDFGTTITYSISGGSDAGRFQINTSTGALNFITAPDFEAPTDAGADNVYNVIVRASDGALFDEQAISVTVTNVFENEAPVITSNGGGAGSSITHPENTVSVTTVTAVDVNASQTVTYSIVGGMDSSLFQINPSTGALSFIAVPDFEVPSDAGLNNVYIVTVRASDGALFDDQSIAVTVADLEEGLSSLFDETANYVVLPSSGAWYALGGSDTVIGTAGDDWIDGADGYDNLYGGSGSDTLLGGALEDIVVGDAGGDALYGNDGGDVLSELYDVSNSGNDLFDGGNGIDIMYSAAGDDIVYGGTDAANNYGNLGDGNDSYFGSAGTDVVEAGNGNDTIFGNTGDDSLYGGADNDTISGGDGIDLLSGSTGDDTLDGGAGNDLLIGDEGNDMLRGGSGIDVLYGFAGDDILDGGTGASVDALFGGAGNDSFRVGGSGYGTDYVWDFQGGVGTSDRILVETGVAYTTSASSGNFYINFSNGSQAVIVGRSTVLAEDIVSNGF